jgi:hypothetical protein
MNSYKRALLTACLMILAISTTARVGAESAEKGDRIEVLYVTSVGWYHDYEQQADLITGAIGRRLPAAFDVIVGDIERLRNTDFAAGYDVLIYNFCHAGRRDSKLIDNLIRPVRDQGIPLLALHCTMHSFQHAEEWYDLLGLKTLRHEEQRAFTLDRGVEHPVTSTLEFPWQLASDELYINLSVGEGSKALMTAYGVETQKHHLQAWLHLVNGTPVLATTLGHGEDTLLDPQFQQFLANSVAFLAGRLDDEGALQLPAACIGDCPVEVSMLTANVSFPTADERSCVIKTMFGIGIPAVEGCEKRCREEGELLDAECTKHCQISEPWPTPESLWPDCKER